MSIVDLTDEAGIPLSFNPDTLEMIVGRELRQGEFWKKTLESGELWKSLKISRLYAPNLWTYRNPNSVLYCGIRGVYWNDKGLLK